MIEQMEEIFRANYLEPKIVVSEIFDLFISTIDSREDEIADLLFDEFYAAHSTTTRIINIIKERCK